MASTPPFVVDIRMPRGARRLLARRVIRQHRQISELTKNVNDAVERILDLEDQVRALSRALHPSNGGTDQ